MGSVRDFLLKEVEDADWTEKGYARIPLEIRNIEFKYYIDKDKDRSWLVNFVGGRLTLFEEELKNERYVGTGNTGTFYISQKFTYGDRGEKRWSMKEALSLVDDWKPVIIRWWIQFKDKDWVSNEVNKIIQLVKDGLVKNLQSKSS